MEKETAATLLLEADSVGLTIFRLLYFDLHSSPLTNFFSTVRLDITGELPSFNTVSFVADSCALTVGVTFGLKFIFKLAHDLLE